jgi:hypothetical protein
MKKITLYTLVLLLVSVFSFAQDKNTTTVDVSAAFGSGFSPSLGISKKWGIDSKGRFKIGTGLRLTNFSGSNLDFITAPADLTVNDANIDTLRLGSAAVTYAAVPIHLQYSFGDKFDIGFNIDLVGLTFGSEQSGTFTTSQSAELNNSTQTGSPTSPNILLVGDNDRGSLNSELYARYWATEKFGIRAGLSFQFVEYTTDRELTFNNDRFRAKLMQPMVSVTYKFW